MMRRMRPDSNDEDRKHVCAGVCCHINPPWYTDGRFRPAPLLPFDPSYTREQVVRGLQILFQCLVSSAQVNETVIASTRLEYGP